MSTKLVVAEQAGLQEVREPWPEQPILIKTLAQVVSWIFHPIFLPVYVLLFMVYEHPYLYAGFSGWQKSKIIFMGLLMFTFFPLLTVLLLKALKFINSIFLRTQKDRVIPFIATMIWYFWVWYVWKNMADIPDAVEVPLPTVKFALACFISTIVGLMVNILMKVSLHAIAVGVVSTFILLLAFNEGLLFGTYLSIAIFVTGLVCTSRFIISDHTSREIYWGLSTGVASMLLASWLG